MVKLGTLGIVIVGIILCAAIVAGVFWFSQENVYRNKVRLNKLLDAEYPNTSWVCDEPYISLHFSEEFGASADKYDKVECIILYNGEQIEAELHPTTPGHGMFIRKGATISSDENILFEGLCKFQEDRIIMKVTADNLFEGAYKKIVLERVENDV